jgi:hypothetical protein
MAGAMDKAIESICHDDGGIDPNCEAARKSAPATGGVRKASNWRSLESPQIQTWYSCSSRIEEMDKNENEDKNKLGIRGNDGPPFLICGNDGPGGYLESW